MANKSKSIRYSEPVDFIPKSIRKEMQLGEYSKDQKSEKKVQRKPVKK